MVGKKWEARCLHTEVMDGRQPTVDGVARFFLLFIALVVVARFVGAIYRRFIPIFIGRQGRAPSGRRRPNWRSRARPALRSAKLCNYANEPPRSLRLSTFGMSATVRLLPFPLFHLVLPIVPWRLPTFTEFSCVFPSFTRFHLVLLGIYRVLLGFTEFYWVLPSFTEFDRVLLGFT